LYSESQRDKLFHKTLYESLCVLDLLEMRCWFELFLSSGSHNLKEQQLCIDTLFYRRGLNVKGALDQKVYLGKQRTNQNKPNPTQRSSRSRRKGYNKPKQERQQKRKIETTNMDILIPAHAISTFVPRWSH
jgi:hypothetical protein